MWLHRNVCGSPWARLVQAFYSWDNNTTIILPCIYYFDPRGWIVRQTGQLMRKTIESRCPTGQPTIFFFASILRKLILSRRLKKLFSFVNWKLFCKTAVALTTFCHAKPFFFFFNGNDLILRGQNEKENISLLFRLDDYYTPPSIKIKLLARGLLECVAVVSGAKDWSGPIACNRRRVLPFWRSFSLPSSLLFPPFFSFLFMYIFKS